MLHLVGYGLAVLALMAPWTAGHCAPLASGLLVERLVGCSLSGRAESWALGVVCWLLLVLLYASVQWWYPSTALTVGAPAEERKSVGVGWWLCAVASAVLALDAACWRAPFDAEIADAVDCHSTDVTTTAAARGVRSASEGD